MEIMMLKAITAAEALTGLQEQELDYQTAWAVWRLGKILLEQISFYQQQEQKLMQEFGERDADGQLLRPAPGKWKIASREDLPEVEKRMRAMQRMRVQINWEPVTVPAPERIRPAQLAALDGLLEFEEAGT